MNSSAERILYRKSALIFEQLAFLTPRPASGHPHHNGSTCAIVSFNGPFAGYLQVSLSQETARQLSCSMLAQESASDETSQQDALGEIANIICGNALPAIFGSEKVFHLEAPFTDDRKCSIYPSTEFCQAAHARIFFDVGTAEVTLYVQSNALNALSQ